MNTHVKCKSCAGKLISFWDIDINLADDSGFFAVMFAILGLWNQNLHKLQLDHLIYTMQSVKVVTQFVKRHGKYKIGTVDWALDSVYFCYNFRSLGSMES